MISKFKTNFLALLLSILYLNINAQRIDSIDVVHYNLNLKIQQLPTKQIHGFAKLKVKVNFAGLNRFYLDLQKLSVDSILLKDKKVSFTRSDSTILVQTETILNVGDTFDLQVFYAGTPVTDPRWGGFFFSGNYAYNMGVGMGSNPPTFGRCWFPCIDNFTDRATYEFHITTDSGFMAVCCGLQSPASINTDGSITWNWNLSQTIPTYLANVAVSKYVLLNSSYAGLQRNIPMILAVSPSDTSKAKASFSRLANAMQCFEDKFGPYLFDRVGFVGVPFNSGAMEHACNISYPLYAVDGAATYETLMAHELSHHWWGNLVTTRTASDMWLNEGWASYCEALFLECVYGKNAYDEKIASELFDALRNATVRDQGYKPVSGVPLAQTYGTHVYTKGGLMAHNLRLLMGDQNFFAACRSYLSAHKFKDVSSIDLKNEFQKFTNQDLNSFFNSFIFDKGHLDAQYYSSNTNTGAISGNVMSRYKTQFANSLLLHLGIYYKDGSKKLLPKLIAAPNSAGTFNFNISKEDLDNIAFLVVNENSGMALGSISEARWIKTMGVQNFASTLFTATVQTNSDSSFLHVQHHYAGPWIASNQLPANVFVSAERFWQVNGILSKDFKATAFFNYDGSANSRLDAELIGLTEDSLVLLYRSSPAEKFKIITDLTFQPGPSKTDKVGRFWVNDLKIGEYAFGYKAVSTSIFENESEIEKLLVYPNPSETGKYTIDLPLMDKTAQLSVFTNEGKLILTKSIKKNLQNTEIDLGEISNINLAYVILEVGNKKYKATLLSK